MKELRPTKVDERNNALRQISQAQEQRNQTLAQAILERDLYFRVSLLGACNLRCPFCHNEGAGLDGIADLAFVTAAGKTASHLGFRRIQLTGGEPLLHPEVDRFVATLRDTFSDVGITTNGTFLQSKIRSLLVSGVTRLHISLQAEELRKWGSQESWGIPPWLIEILEMSSSAKIFLRLNMPIPASELQNAFGLLRDLAESGCDVKVFSILPEGNERENTYPLALLRQEVDIENQRRRNERQQGMIVLRDFRQPQGFRCETCSDRNRCREQSHSLRLGADRILRPC